VAWDADRAVQDALTKFAVSGSLYARALGATAARSGGRVAPRVLEQVAGQPRARLAPGLAAAARAPGVLAPSPSQRDLQGMMELVPWASAEHGGDPAAAHRYQQVVQLHGRSFTQPGLQSQIDAAFGALPNPRATRADLGEVAAGHRRAAPDAATGVNLRAKVATSVAGVAKAMAPYAIGAGIPLLTAGGLLAAKPAIRSNLRNLMESKGTIEQKDLAAPLPESVLGTAAQVHQHLKDRGIDPTTLRIAVDAPPGSGKTTLSRALARQLGVQHYGLDWLPHNKLHAVLGGGRIEKMPRAPRAGEILEHYNLLRSYDPELFDAVFHIAKDPETIKQQLLGRGRSAGVSTVMDYDKSIAVGRLAFDTLAGEPVDLGNGTLMKLRPREGWGGGQLDAALAQIGVDPAGLSRHEKLLSLHARKRETGAGWTPYFKSPFSRGEAAAIAGTVPLGLAAALTARHLLR
jgi:hypothetical protein